MDYSIVLAQLLGPFIIAIGLGVIINAKALPLIGDGFSKNLGLVFLSGVFTLLGGLTILLFHNIWAADWRLIITIFGWITLIKGLWLTVLPQTVAKVAGLYLKNTSLVLAVWIIMLLFGAFLTSKGYFPLCL